MASKLRDTHQLHQNYLGILKTLDSEPQKDKCRGVPLIGGI